MKGKLSLEVHREYYVTCYDCERMDVAHYETKVFAERDFREEGWRIRKGKWYCENCIDKMRNGQ